MNYSLISEESKFSYEVRIERGKGLQMKIKREEKRKVFTENRRQAGVKPKAKSSAKRAGKKK